MAGREALATGGHVAAEHRIGHRGPRAVANHEALHDRLEVDERHDQGGDRQAPPPEDQGHQRHDEPRDQVAQLLQGPQGGVEPAGQIVDGAEHPAFRSAHRSGVGDDPADHDGDDADHGQHKVAAKIRRRYQRSPPLDTGRRRHDESTVPARRSPSMGTRPDPAACEGTMIKANSDRSGRCPGGPAARSYSAQAFTCS
jgi:hypothetical protein